MFSSRWYGKERIKQSWYFLFYKPQNDSLRRHVFDERSDSSSRFVLWLLFPPSVLVIVGNMPLLKFLCSRFCWAQLLLPLSLSISINLEFGMAAATAIGVCFFFVLIGRLLLLIFFNFLKWFWNWHWYDCIPCTLFF